jgi:hypothetical protein
MGYLTFYKVTIQPFNQSLYNDLLDGGFCPDNECKWYNYDDDCLTISDHYLNHMIVVQGSGEDAGDIWKNVYMNGKVIWRWKLNAEIPEIPIDLYSRYQSAPGLPIIIEEEVTDTEST